MAVVVLVKIKVRNDRKILTMALIPGIYNHDEKVL